jgi:hypothetical protein
MLPGLLDLSKPGWAFRHAVLQTTIFARWDIRPSLDKRLRYGDQRLSFAVKSRSSALGDQFCS